jgi:hypothetical protein
LFKTQNAYFWAGVLLYAVSFFLAAVAGDVISSPPARGYHCALYALLIPLGDFSGGPPLTHTTFELVSLFISGWINPVFLLAVAVGFLTQRRSMIVFFRTVVVLMMPFCWVVFLYEHLYPREGYVLWTLGMLLTMFSQPLPRNPGACPP